MCYDVVEQCHAVDHSITFAFMGAETRCSKVVYVGFIGYDPEVSGASELQEQTSCRMLARVGY